MREGLTDDSEKRALRGLLCGAGAVVIFSFTGLIVKYTSPTLTHWEVLFYRSAVSTLALLPGVFKQKPFLGHRKAWLVLRGFLGFISLSASFYTLQNLPLVNAVLIFQFAPLFVIPLAALLLKEPTPMLDVILVILGLAGVALVIQPTRGIIAPASFVGLGAAFVAAVNFVQMRVLGRTERTSVIVFYLNAFTTVCAVPFLIGKIHPLSLPLALMLLLNAAASLIGHWLMTKAFTYQKAQKIAILNFAGVPLAALWGFVFWSEVPGLLTVVGGLIALGAVTAIQIRKQKR